MLRRFVRPGLYFSIIRVMSIMVIELDINIVVQTVCRKGINPKAEMVINFGIQIRVPEQLLPIYIILMFGLDSGSSPIFI